MTSICKVTIEYPDGKQQTLEFDHQALTLGRTDDNDIILEHPSISRTHAKVILVEQLLEVTDLGSSNGSYINGKKITQTKAVKPGDLVSFGEVKVRFYIPEKHLQTQMMSAIKAPGAEQATQMLTGIDSLADIDVVLPNQTRKKHIITKEVTSIGRDEKNDIIIDEQTVSRRHIHIVREGDNYSFCKQPDCSSKVLLNGQEVEQGKLKAGDQVTLGLVQLTFKPQEQQQQIQQQQASKKRYLNFVLAFVFVLAGGLLLRHFFSPEQLALSHINKGEQLLAESSYFSAVNQFKMAANYQSHFDETLNKRYFKGLVKAQIEHGVNLVRSQRWKESLLYFEQGFENANRNFREQDLLLLVEEATFSTLSDYLLNLLSKDKPDDAASLYTWLEKYFIELKQAELQRLKQQLHAKQVAYDVQTQVAQLLSEQQTGAALQALAGCSKQPLASISACQQVVQNYHGQLYDLLNQKLQDSQQSAAATSVDVKQLLKHATLLVSLVPNVATYQTMQQQTQDYYHTLIAQEKLRKELSDDEVDVEDF